MNRFLVLVAVVITLINSSCDDSEMPKEVVVEVAQKTSDTLKIPVLTGIKPALKLTPEATDTVNNWIFYKDLTRAIDSLSGPTMGELKPRIDRLSEIFQEKKNAEEVEAPTSPKIVQTKAIQSRILAIQTQLNILRNNSNRNIPDMDQVAAAIVKVKNGLQNLNLQINERFSISINDLLDEIRNEDDDSPSNPQTEQPSGRPRIQTN